MFYIVWTRSQNTLRVLSDSGLKKMKGRKYFLKKLATRNVCAKIAHILFTLNTSAQQHKKTRKKKRRRHTSGIGTKRQTWSGMPPRSALSNAHPGPFWRTGVATNVFPRIVRVSTTKIISLHITMTMKVQPSTRPTVDWASAYCSAQRAAAKSSANLRENFAVHQWSSMFMLPWLP